jgi:myo-inositol-hexaphosphate 3-phosphohydrolase
MPASRAQALPGMSRRVVIAALVVLALVASLAAFLVPARAVQPTGDTTAVAETDPVASPNDAADDVAIWVNPADATKSVIIGTDKQAGLNVYDLTGHQIQTITSDGLANNVDLRYGFPLGGQAVDVVAVAGNGFLRLYKVDPATGHLENVTSGTIAPVVTHGGKINGVCLYQSPVSHDTFAFVDASSGQMQQLRLKEDAANPGKITTELVRGGGPAGWDVSQTSDPTISSPVENCVADDELQTLYVSEQSVAIWKYGAEPTASTATRTSVDVAAPTGHFTADVEGLALVPTGAGTGYLMASSQGSDAFEVYRREGNNDFVREFHIADGATVDGCTKTDGIEAVAANLGPNFPEGMFVCQDFKNFDASHKVVNQNYKMVPLNTVVDTVAPVSDTTTTTAPATDTTTTTAPAVNQPTARRSGYWMVGADGKVYPFGDAKSLGDAPVMAGAEAVDLEPTPSGDGYWVVDSAGHVYGMNARWLGNADTSKLVAGEKVTSLSSTPSGNGYWIFTTRGRVLPVGDAVFHGDMSAVALNGPVLDSIPSASGNGYYMVASDGGIFTMGDATFLGSMGDTKLNAPVQSLVPSADGKGYWLVASDGGIFSFGSAPFRGSMGDKKLNKPVTGMVRFGNGYLMVAEDGGIFNFSDKAFFGSLGDHPPAHKVVSVAALDMAVL